MPNEMIKTHRALNYKQMGEKWVGGGGLAGNLSPGELATLDFPQGNNRQLLKQQFKKTTSGRQISFSLSLVRGDSNEQCNNFPSKGWPLVEENGHLAWLLTGSQEQLWGQIVVVRGQVQVRGSGRSHKSHSLGFLSSSSEERSRFPSCCLAPVIYEILSVLKFTT